MKKLKKVSMIGHFGFGKELSNGQTIKTKIVSEALSLQLGHDNVINIDTHGGIKSLFKAPFHVIKALRSSQNIIILPAHNGLRIYAPLLALLKVFFKNKKMHYVVIGGWLPDFVKQRKWLAKKLKALDCIYVETNTMRRALEEQGFTNVYVMPNGKNLTVLSEQELIYPSGVPYRLCTFSRVMKEKGIEDAVNAIITVNAALGYQAFSLDIYGQVDAEQTEWFEDLQKRFPAYIRYGGLVPFDKSVEVLKEYFALLFPTYYEGEGLAGTLIDAYSAGVPVIASDWKYNPELVNENVGYVYHTGNQNELVDVLKTVAMNPAMLFSKKQLCLKEAEKYRIDKTVRVLIEQIESQ